MNYKFHSPQGGNTLAGKWKLPTTLSDNSGFMPLVFIKVFGNQLLLLKRQSQSKAALSAMRDTDNLSPERTLLEYVNVSRNKVSRGAYAQEDTGQAVKKLSHSSGTTEDIWRLTWSEECLPVWGAPL